MTSCGAAPARRLHPKSEQRSQVPSWASQPSVPSQPSRPRRSASPASGPKTHASLQTVESVSAQRGDGLQSRSTLVQTATYAKETGSRRVAETFGGDVEYFRKICKNIFSLHLCAPLKTIVSVGPKYEYMTACAGNTHLQLLAQPKKYFLLFCETQR